MVPKLTLTERFQGFRGFVLVLSGVNIETLDLVPSERPRFESLGWAILITSGIATVSMWFALSSAMGVNGILAIPPALLWGVVIMGIDRWLITSMPTGGKRKIALAAPRFALALLLGTLISTPFVLRVFQSEINAQIAVIQQKDYNAFLAEQQNSPTAKQVITYKSQLQQLDTVISSHGVQTGNTSADPQLAAYQQQKVNLEAELSHWQNLEGQYYKEYNCQLYGGPTCPKAGAGPVYTAAHKNYEQAVSEVATLQKQINQVQREITTRDNQLNSHSAFAEQQRYQQALSAQPQVQSEYNTALQRQNQLQQTYYSQEQASHGILVRLEALSQLSNGNFTVTAARFLLFLLFLVIECLPVTVKLLQRPGLYEEALLHARAAEREGFQEYYSDWPGRLRPQQPAAGRVPAAVQEQANADRQDDVRSIWKPTAVMPRAVGHPDDEIRTEVQGYQSGGGSDRFDEYPPAETDARPSYGWGRSDGSGQQPVDAGRQRDDDLADPYPAEPHLGETTVDPWVAWTRPDGTPYRDPGSDDASQPRHQPMAGGAHRSDGGSEHEALAEMDDAPASARPDGNGIPLSWDDDE
jgi:hypothetical protein